MRIIEVVKATHLEVGQSVIETAGTSMVVEKHNRGNSYDFILSPEQSGAVVISEHLTDIAEDHEFFVLIGETDITILSNEKESDEMIDDAIAELLDHKITPAEYIAVVRSANVQQADRERNQQYKKTRSITSN